VQYYSHHLFFLLFRAQNSHAFRLVLHRLGHLDWCDVSRGTSTNIHVGTHHTLCAQHHSKHLVSQILFPVMMCSITHIIFYFALSCTKQPWIQTDIASSGVPRLTRCQLRHLDKHPAINSDWHCVGWVTSTDNKYPCRKISLAPRNTSIQKHGISLYLDKNWFLVYLYVTKYSHDSYCSFL